MKLLTDWGFTREGWRNNSRGEYLVLLQGGLLTGFVIVIAQLPPSPETASSETVSDCEF